MKLTLMMFTLVTNPEFHIGAHCPAVDVQTLGLELQDSNPDRGPVNTCNKNITRPKRESFNVTVPKKRS